MRYTLIHSTFLQEGEQPQEVAYIDLEETSHSTRMDLETIFQLTNNIEGSWSMGPTLPGGEVNEDYDERIIRIVPLKKHKGREYGLRSTSVGDHVRTEDGELWICAVFGWEQVQELELNNYRAGRA